ncbi:MAG TPA: hypothetical protein VFO07_03775 [Roseiflexaceae bacterium]|nr:hypothetical protein [Roseiflexaceae bacterium]
MLSLLQPAPVMVAEQLVCEVVAALLVQLAEGEAQPPIPATGGTIHQIIDALTSSVSRPPSRDSSAHNGVVAAGVSNASP